LSGIESEMTSIEYDNRHIALDAIPVGADVDRIHEIQKLPRVKKQYSRLEESKGDFKIFLGVDRLDYTKGITARLEAYEDFLENNPKWRGKVEFYQIMVPSRTEVSNYSQLKHQIDALAGKINAEYGRHDWTPVRCFFRQFSMEDLVNYYAIADVAVVTPLRDGMNLVAKEFLLAQHTESPGVLILSEFCGAASELSDALIVNPVHRKQVSEAYLTALEMNSDEVQRRYKAMLTALEVYSAKNWGERFIGSLRMASERSSNLSPEFSLQLQKQTRQNYAKAKQRLILLDYDGTLTDIVNSPKRAMPTSEILNLLKKLKSDPRNTVMIVSGRPKQTLEEWLMQTGVLLCGEHGAWIWDGKEWQKTYYNTHPRWKQQIRPVMELYTSRTAGSFIEEKDEALAWHFRLSEPDYGEWQAKNLLFNLESLLDQMPLQSLMGKKVIEVRHKSVSKGTAWKWFQK
ncbi:MAG: trehalose-phosphatase, partial [Candidatus Omnitrophica bacterium]|nr:trehalose-phosphatase [Candidatus Omnitrophota bacterium]